MSSDQTHQTLQWPPSRRQMVWAVVIGALLTLTILLILGHVRKWAWVGIEGATLWHWMDLLIIPGVLALGAFELNQRAMRQEEMEEQRAKQREKKRTLLLKLHDDFFQTYNTAKSIRRTLRAEATYETPDKKLMIKMAPYKEQMYLLSNVQLQFEQLRAEVNTHYNSYLERDAVKKTRQLPSVKETISGNLRKMESYLSKIVTEYEKVNTSPANDGQISHTDVPASELPVLAEFLTKARNTQRFRSNFSEPADTISAALRGVISSME